MGDWGMRPATADDVEAVVEIRAVAMRADLERLGRYDEHRVRQRLRDGFVPAHTRVVEVDGATGPVLAGCVALRPADDDPHAPAYWLEHFYLAPWAQGRGIGTAVLRELLEDTDRVDARVRLNVLQGSAARRLYERHGFVLDREDAVDVFLVRESTPRAGW
ncbi:GNAT family N-acetyltransferase [Streptomyces sp. NBC_01275]|uniref:GNAT family N-acetyltransferase n=1 Tax=Streptomyces sp. NBC_01275 TaxID=2903807 RepID=UPI0022503DE7|nr:GNAT family N-acetyltransferase [Streptomyces sp. NBC_01275]MCX4763576.1 GNAT family N-acetyltransferase [Streptomyces sp. NBC_01275]